MQSLALKYRPDTFEDVVAQGHVKTILTNQIRNKEFRSAYLFCGGAGTGKTTSARIVAKDINEGKGKPIEIDGASNNGVDNIREIIDNCKFKSLDGKYKVYIIDEVHMLSIGAFNALLKTLEEPPADTIFILCTTDPQKIPATILSRVQRFDFKRIPTTQIISRLQFIIQGENTDIVDAHCGSQDAQHDIEWAIKEGIPVIEYDPEAIEYIAKLAAGGMRDSITMLEKVLGYTNDITMEAVVQSLGVPDYGVFFGLIENIIAADVKDVIATIEDGYMNGQDLKLFMRNFTDFVLDLCKYNITKKLELTAIPTVYEGKISDNIVEEQPFLLDILASLSKLCQIIKWESSPKQIIEAELIMLCQQ